MNKTDLSLLDERVIFDHGMQKDVTGRIICVERGGRYGSNFEIMLDKPKMVFGKMSRRLVLKKGAFKVIS